MIGTVIADRYEILEEIGIGGTARVYAAQDTRLDRKVAVKVLREDIMSDPKAKKRFTDEARAVAALNHPNIVAVYDFGTSGGVSYIVMEYIEGKTLKECIDEKGALTWRETITLGLQICDALEHAHEHKIIHRDIKPHNIIVMQNGTVKVTDFGIAQTKRPGGTVSNNSMGTAHYLSPEQAHGGYIDEKTDIYSFGITLYEMVTGKVPFEGDLPVTVAMMHINETPVPPLELAENLPPAMNQLILKAMSKKQRDRYASIAEMKKDMLAIRYDPTALLTDEHKEPPRYSTKEEQDQNGKKDHTEETKKGEGAGIVVGIILSVLIVLGLGWFLVSTMLGGSRENTFVMPYLVEKTVDEANLLYGDKGLTVVVGREVPSDTVEEGKICAQDTERGVKLKLPATVYVDVSTGKEKYNVGNYITMNYRVVTAELTKANVLFEVEFEENDEYPKDCIFRQSPAPGGSLAQNDKLILYVSNGIENTTVPNLKNYTEEDALTALSDAELLSKVEYDYDDTVAEGKVIFQNIAPFTMVAKRTTIVFTVSRGKKPAEPAPPVNNDHNTEDKEPPAEENNESHHQKKNDDAVSENGL